MKKMFLPLFACVIINTSCHTDKKEPIKLVRPVKSATAGTQSIIRKEFYGIVEPVEYVKLSFPLSGRINNLSVKEGQRVKKGDLIATLNSESFELQYAAEKAAYETATAQLQRNRRLVERQAISQQEYEISKANYQKALTAYKNAADDVADTRLTAPFDGSIQKRLAEQYQRINAGEGVVQLVNTENLHIKFTIPDTYLYLLHSPKQNYIVEFDIYRGHYFNARLIEYLDISTYGTGIPVTIAIDDSTFNSDIYDIKPGFTCGIRLTSDIEPFLQKEMVCIPLSAVFSKSHSDKEYVWIIRNNRVYQREIHVYSPTGESDVLIDNGLNAGEQIVTAGVYQLVEGDSVRIMHPERDFLKK